jgi:hypothetical protein
MFAAATRLKYEQATFPIDLMQIIISLLGSRRAAVK